MKTKKWMKNIRISESAKQFENDKITETLKNHK